MKGTHVLSVPSSPRVHPLSLCKPHQAYLNASRQRFKAKVSHYATVRPLRLHPTITQIFLGPSTWGSVRKLKGLGKSIWRTAKLAGEMGTNGRMRKVGGGVGGGRLWGDLGGSCSTF